MSAYMFNVGKGDLCQHMLSISPSYQPYMFIGSIGNPCQHRLYMSEYMNNIGMGNLCQHRLSSIYVGIYYLCHLTCSLIAKVIYVSIDYLRWNT